VEVLRTSEFVLVKKELWVKQIPICRMEVCYGYETEIWQHEHFFH
jgi:hypothetical protein